MSDVEVGESQSGLLPITCRRCSRTVRIGLPVGIDDLDAMTRAFEQRHESCTVDREAFLRGAEQMQAEAVKMLLELHQQFGIIAAKECAFEVKALPLPVPPRDSLGPVVMSTFLDMLRLETGLPDADVDGILKWVRARR
jgi:hypothetical protein